MRIIDMGGITIWGMAGESESEPRAKAKAKTTDRSVRSTRAEATSKAAGEGARSTLTPKQLGEIAEAEFIAKAVGLGFVVARPWGDSEPYDFIVNPKKSFIFGGCR
jgi:PD-(D/E)XK endonuclease